MSINFAQFTPYLRVIQEDLMTERCRIIRDSVLVVDDVPCRVTSSRLFAEPPDPSDANMRSMQEWGWTLPLGFDVEVGDTLEKMDGSLSTIAGEVMKDDTWATAIRVWATRPKSSVPHTTVTIWRFDDTAEVWAEQDTYDVQVVWDRNRPEETPVRYAPAARTMYKGGWIIGALAMDVRVGDRFALGDNAAFIVDVAMFQPQRTEAKFRIDISGSNL